MLPLRGALARCAVPARSLGPIGAEDHARRPAREPLAPRAGRLVDEQSMRQPPGCERSAQSSSLRAEPGGSHDTGNRSRTAATCRSTAASGTEASIT